MRCDHVQFHATHNSVDLAHLGGGIWADVLDKLVLDVPEILTLRCTMGVGV